jgi:hypothetical protein
LLIKLKLFLPAPYHLLIRSYLENRSFSVRQGNYISSIFQIQAGVPQGYDLFPDLFNIFTSDIPQTDNTILTTYADTAILSSNSNPIEASFAPQLHLNQIENWSLKWKIKINAIHVPFTLNKKNSPALIFQGAPIPSQ